jgi:hypothetical protein
MLPKNKADYIIMTVIFIIFIGAAIGGVLLHIRNQSIENELNQKRRQLNALKLKLESIQDAALRSRGTLTGEEDQFTSLMPFDHQQQEIFRGGLERLARDNHVKLIKSELSSPPFALKDDPEYQVSQWQLILNGDYRGFVGFLEALPRNVRLAMISKLKITPEYLQGNQYQLNARLTLDIISNAVTN